MMADTSEFQLKKVPTRIKSLIKNEAAFYRRSINQECIALLEEALLARAQAERRTRDQIDDILERFDKLPTRDPRPLSEMIEYDELGLPK
jgi:hypothetical protein